MFYLWHVKTFDKHGTFDNWIFLTHQLNLCHHALNSLCNHLFIYFYKMYVTSSMFYNVYIRLVSLNILLKIFEICIFFKAQCSLGTIAHFFSNKYFVSDIDQEKHMLFTFQRSKNVRRKNIHRVILSNEVLLYLLNENQNSPIDYRETKYEVISRMCSGR